MQRLPLATRPPVPFHDASSSCFVVPRGKAACCCGSLKQERRDRAAHFAVAAIAATGRTAAPFLAAALLLAAGPPGLPASIPPGFSNLSLLVLRITDVMHVKNADVRGKKAFLFEGASRCPPGRLRVKPNPSRRHPPTPLPRARCRRSGSPAQPVRPVGMAAVGTSLPRRRRCVEFVPGAAACGFPRRPSF
jgi:hypothetical protein